MFWGGGMLLWEALSRSHKHIKPLVSLADVLCWAFLGLPFGLGITFGWRAYHWPLILFIAVAFVAGMAFARLAKRKIRSEGQPSGYGLE